jgi:ABC-2 type transport system permease protein
VEAVIDSGNVATIKALIRRARNEIIRVPGAAIPGVLAPTIFFLGLTSVFGALHQLNFPGDNYQSWLIAVSMLQGAGFTGAATGVNLARDIELGWFDRLLASPAPRWVLLTGLVSSASVRSLIPATFLVIVGLAIGVHFPGIPGLVIAAFLVMGMGLVAALWGCLLALHFKSQSAAPLMQAGMFILVLFTTAYAPANRLQDWMHTVADVNPVTHVIDAARQGFVATVTFADTWPAFVALAGLIIFFGALAMRELHNFTS